MRTRLLFYKTGNTEVNEKIVRSALAKFGLTLGGTVSADNPQELTRALARAVEISELILIVGGLDSPARDNTARVLSSALNIRAQEAGISRASYIIEPSRGIPQPTLEGCTVLPSRLGGPDGIALDAGTQCIICLPDNEAQLSDMLQGSAAEHFSAIYGLTELSLSSYSNSPAPESVTELTADDVDRILEQTLNLSNFGARLGSNIHDEKPVKIHGRRKISPGRIILRILIVISVLSIILSVFYVGYNTYNDQDGEYTAREVYNEIYTLYNIPAGRTNLPTGVLSQFGALYETNPDIKGWFNVPGTDMAFPVVQSRSDEPGDFYSNHDFYKDKNSSGALYFDKDNIIIPDKACRNHIIYGNSLKNGGMLSGLKNYRDIEYFRAHPLIQMDTIYQQNMWRVYSVALVSSDTLYEFNYENTAFLGESSVEQYLYQMFIRSMFYTSVDVFPTDNLLTIITDSDEFEGAKLIIGARAVREDEDLSGMYDGVLENPFVLMPEIWYEMNNVDRPEVPGYEFADKEEPEPEITTKKTAKSTTSTKKSNQEKTSKTTKKTTAKTTAKNSSNNSNKPYVPSGKTMRITSNGKVLSGTIEEILPRIVEAEMGAPFHIESLKAQAIAAYTFYIYSGGAAKAPSFPTKKATQKSIDAVKAVAGKQMTFGGKTPYTPYYAISAGRSADNSLVNVANLSYLKSVDCSVDKKVSGFETTKTYSSEKVRQRIKSKTGIDLSGVAKNKWFVIESRDSNGLYVKKVNIGGKKTYKGATVWSSVLGSSYVRSPCYWITYNSSNDTFTFKTRGYGGCVGFSQKGAGEYAKQGKDYIWILKHFYTGVEIK